MNPERNLGFFPRVPASKRWRERENRKKKDEKGNIKIGESEVFRYSYKKRNTGKMQKK